MRILEPQCTSEEMRRYWNHVASLIRPFCGALSTRVYLEQEIEPIKKYLGPDLKGKKMLKLDLWNEAFNTEVLMWAARQGIKIYALDVSDKVVNIAHQKMKKLGLSHYFVVADMRDIPFKNNSFDLVYSMGTLEHIGDTKTVIKEIYRVLKKNGVAITGVPNKHDLFLRAPILAFANKIGLIPYGEELSFSRKEINKLFNSCQFKVIDEEGIFLPWFLRYPDMRLYAMFRPLCAFFNLPLKLVRKLAYIKKFRQTSGIITCIARKV